MDWGLVGSRCRGILEAGSASGSSSVCPSEGEWHRPGSLGPQTERRGQKDKVLIITFCIPISGATPSRKLRLL